MVEPICWLELSPQVILDLAIFATRRQQRIASNILGVIELDAQLGSPLAERCI